MPTVCASSKAPFLRLFFLYSYLSRLCYFCPNFVNILSISDLSLSIFVLTLSNFFSTLHLFFWESSVKVSHHMIYVAMGSTGISNCTFFLCRAPIQKCDCKSSHYRTTSIFDLTKPKQAATAHFALLIIFL